MSMCRLCRSGFDGRIRAGVLCTKCQIGLGVLAIVSAVASCFATGRNSGPSALTPAASVRDVRPGANYPPHRRHCRLVRLVPDHHWHVQARAPERVLCRRVSRVGRLPASLQLLTRRVLNADPSVGMILYGRWGREVFGVIYWVRCRLL